MQKREHETERDYSIKVVDKALKLLELLAEHEEGISLTQLSQHVTLTRNSTFRIIQTLHAKGLVERGNKAGIYRLGFCSVTLAQKMMKNMSVVNFAHPVLEDLARTLNEDVYLTVLKDDDVLFLDMVDCHQQIRTAPLLGRMAPLLTNAAGKVMKSFDSRDSIWRRFKRKGTQELEKLDEELLEIRTKGVAVDSGGLGEGIISVAVAIRDYTGRVIGAITLIGPSFRVLAGRLETEIIPSLKNSADILSGRFGYCPA